MTCLIARSCWRAKREIGVIGEFSDVSKEMITAAPRVGELCGSRSAGQQAGSGKAAAGCTQSKGHPRSMIHDSGIVISQVLHRAAREDRIDGGDDEEGEKT
jgi:hypothetical protein